MDRKIEMPMKRRTLMQLAAGAAFMMTGALAVPGTTLAEDSVLKGKNLAYIAFGLQYEYQVTLVDHVKKLAAESVDFLEDFPYEFRALWDRVRKGKLSIPLEHKIDPKGFEPLRVTLDSIANRLTNAILASSVLIGSSILILSGIPPRLWDIPIIGLVGLIWGAYMCLRLVLSIWKQRCASSGRAWRKWGPVMFLIWSHGSTQS